MSRAPAAKRQPKPLIPAPRDEAILKALAQYRFLTAQEITHLCYSGWVGKNPNANGKLPTGSHTYARARLSALSGNRDITGGGLTYDYPLYRIGFPTGNRGRNERFFALSLTGARMLHFLGIPGAWYVRPSRLRTYSHSYLLHDLARNRFVVALLSWAKSMPNISIEPRLSYELAKNPAVVEIAEQRSCLVEGKPVQVTALVKVLVIPDGILLVTNRRTGERLLLLFEIDHNTLTLPRFRKHIAARLAYARSPVFTKVYGAIPYRIAYATQGVTESASQARLKAMCKCTMALLTERKRQQDSRYFRFTTINFATLYEDAKRLLEGPSWYLPSDIDLKSPVPLLIG